MAKRKYRIPVSSEIIEDIKIFRKSNKISQCKTGEMIGKYGDFMANFETGRIFSVTKEEMTSINKFRGKSYLPTESLFIEDVNDVTLLYLYDVISSEKEKRGI